MKRPTTSAARLGVVMLVVTVVVAGLLFSKDRISTMLMSGDTVSVHFDRAYKLRPFISEVKVGYVPVGRVTQVVRQQDGSARVKLKVDGDVLDRLGSAPTATIRPTTLLGGIYFVDLAPGGDPGRFRSRAIPRRDSRVPVELDRVAGALQPDALAGMQSALRNTDEVLGSGGKAALRRLMDGAEEQLLPTARVLEAAQGRHPEEDLTQVVDGLEGTARALTKRDGQLASIVSSLDTTAAVLARESSGLGAAVAGLPPALESTRTALASLDESLVELRGLSADARGVARELDSTLVQLEPTLASAQPLVRDLRQVLADAQPMVRHLVPSAGAARQIVEDLRGPVVERVNDQALPFLSAPYQGEAPYAQTRSKEPLYKDVVLALANVTRASSMVDKNGHGVSFTPGPGVGSIGGLPISLDQMTRILRAWTLLDEPVETVPPLNGPFVDRKMKSFVDKLLGGAR